METFLRALAPGLCVLLLACAPLSAPDPQRDEARRILQALDAAHAELLNGSNVDDACNTAHQMRVQIYGVPGQSRIAATWALLNQANQDLMGACGASQLATTPVESASDTVSQARQRWQADTQTLLGQMCAPLAQAATQLAAPPPAC